MELPRPILRATLLAAALPLIGGRLGAQVAGARVQPIEFASRPNAGSGALQIDFASPTGAVAEAPGAVTIVFSKPMRALATTTATAHGVASIQRLHDRADADGHWVWYGAQTAVFYWATNPTRASEYEVVVPATTRALDGSTLGSPAAFRFTTPAATVRTVNVDLSEVATAYRVVCEFDQPISPEEVRRALRIVARSNGRQRGLSFRVESGDGIARNHATLILERDANHVDDAKLLVAGDLHSAEGPLVSGKPAQFPLPELTTLRGHIDCDRTPAGACQSDSEAISLTFTKPLTNLELFTRAQFTPVVDKALYDLEGESAALDLTNLYKLDDKEQGHFSVTFKHGLRATDGERSGPLRFAFDLAPPGPRLEFSTSSGSITLNHEGLTLFHRDLDGVELFGRHLEPNEFFELLRKPPEHFAAVAGRQSAFHQSLLFTRPEARTGTVALPNEIWQGHDKGAMLLAARGLSSKADSSSLLVTSNLGITTYTSPHGGLVWITRLNDAAPVSGARVELMAEGDGAARFVGTSDQEGLVTLPATALRKVSHALSGERHRLLIRAFAGDDWSYDLIGGTAAASYRPFATVMTDRSLYRPGDIVYVKAFYRLPSPAGYATPHGNPIEVRLVEAKDRVLAQTRSMLDAHGSIFATMQLPRDIAPGWARIEVRSPWTADQRADDTRGFTVAHFRTIDTKSEGHLDRKTYLRGDAATFSVSANTLTGVPLAHGKVQWSAKLSPDPIYQNSFKFSDAVKDPDVTLDERALVLDATGQGKPTVVLQPAEQFGPMRLRVWATVAEVHGQYAIGAGDDAVVYAAEFQPGIALDRDKYFVGDTATTRTVALDTERVRARRPISVTWYQLGTEPNSSSSLARAELNRAKILAHCDTTSDDGDATAGAAPACTLELNQVGRYLARAVSKDERGREAAAAVEFSVWPKKVAPEHEPEPAPRKLEPPELVVPKDPQAFRAWCAHLEAGAFKVFTRSRDRWDDISVGTTVDYCVRAPSPARMSLTFEGNGILEHRLLQLGPGGTWLQQRLERNAYPRVQVRFHGIQPASKQQSGVWVETFVYAPADPSRHLWVSLRPLQPHHPHADSLIEVRVTRLGRPTAAQVTLWAVDEGIASQSYYSVPDPYADLKDFDWFQVEADDNRRRLYLPGQSRHRTRAPSVRMGATNTSARDSFFREDFPPVAWFLPNLMLDGSGRAKVRVRLPDNATTWRIYAVAAGSDDAFGSYSSQLTATQELAIRPKLPRFARVGDRYEARVSIDNQLETPLKAQVELEAHGAATGSLQRSIVLPARGQAHLGLPVVANASGKVTWSAKVETPVARDAIRVSHPVLRTAIEHTVAFSGSVTSESLVPIALPSDLDPSQGSLELRLSTTQRPQFEPARRWLADYPHGCTEQLASRLLAQLVSSEPEALTTAHRTLLERWLLEIMARQQLDGGFGYYPRSSKSDPELTVHVLWALVLARKSTLSLPDSAIGRATRFLESTAAGLSANDRAWLEDVLAVAGLPRRSSIERLAQQTERLSGFARAQLAHAAALGARERAREILAPLLATVAVSGGAAVVPTSGSEASLYASSARSTAAALRALLAIEPQHALVAPLTNGLLALRREGHWQTTQDNLWSWLVFAELNQRGRAPSKLTATVSWGSDVLWRPDSAATDEARLDVPLRQLATRHGQGLRLVTAGGPLYYQGILRVVRQHDVPTALHHGFSIERLLRAADETKAIPVATTEFALGTYVRLDTLVNAPVARDQVLIEVPIPAGLEAIDEALALTPFISLSPLGRSMEPTHKELFDDRVAIYVEHLDAGAHVFSQLLRAATRGTFVTPPARVEAMYAPDLMGQSNPLPVTVK